MKSTVKDKCIVSVIIEFNGFNKLKITKNLQSKLFLAKSVCTCLANSALFSDFNLLLLF